MKTINEIINELKELEPIENICGGIIFNYSDLLIWSDFGNSEWYLTHTNNIHLDYGNYEEIDIKKIKYYIKKFKTNDNYINI